MGVYHCANIWSAANVNSKFTGNITTLACCPGKAESASVNDFCSSKVKLRSDVSFLTSSNSLVLATSCASRSAILYCCLRLTPSSNVNNANVNDASITTPKITSVTPHFSRIFIREMGQSDSRSIPPATNADPATANRKNQIWYDSANSPLLRAEKYAKIAAILAPWLAFFAWVYILIRHHIKNRMCKR